MKKFTMRVIDEQRRNLTDKQGQEENSLAVFELCTTLCVLSPYMYNEKERSLQYSKVYITKRV